MRVRWGSRWWSGSWGLLDDFSCVCFLCRIDVVFLGTYGESMAFGRMVMDYEIPNLIARSLGLYFL